MWYLVLSKISNEKCKLMTARFQKVPTFEILVDINSNLCGVHVLIWSKINTLNIILFMMCIEKIRNKNV